MRTVIECIERIHILLEFWDFFLHRKTWWLVPLVLVLLLLGALMALGEATALAPLIYPLF